MKTLPVLFLLLLSYAVQAQKSRKFGKADLADLKSAICPYDQEAVAEVLIDKGDMQFEPGRSGFYKMTCNRWIRIKILKQKGLEYANVRIRFLSNDHYEKVYNIAGYTFNEVKGKVEAVKVEKQLIFTKKTDDAFSEIVFSFPNVKIGSIIEYRYTTDKESFSNIDPWKFQREIPVKHSEFNIRIPDFFVFSTKTLAEEGLEKKEKREVQSEIRIDDRSNMPVKTGITNYNYVLREVPALKPEPFMNSINDYTQRIEFQLTAIITPDETYDYSSNWNLLAEELNNNSLFGKQLNRKTPIPELDQLVAEGKNAFEKVGITYRYFKNNFAWNGLFDIYCLDVKKTAEEKSGSSGDLNLLLLNKLMEYQIAVSPLLISTKANGIVNMNFPFLKQFNSVNVLFTDNNQNYIMNAADRFNNLQLIPPEIVNTNGLRILKDTCEWISLKNDRMSEKNMVNYRLQVTDSGLLYGTAVIFSSGYAKAPRLETLYTDAKLYNSKFLSHPVMKFNLSEKIFKNENSDSVGLENQFNFSSRIIPNGDYSLLYYNFFTGMDANPFIAGKRNFDIDFNYPRQMTLYAYLDISNGYDFEELPVNIKLMMPDTGIIFKRMIKKEDHVITIQLDFQIQKSVYYAGMYEAIKKFYRQLYELLNEPIVLLRKNNQKG